MLTQPESQAVARQLYHVWFPQIVHNQHQEAPFPARIFVPPFEDPVNPHIPPLVVRGINTVGDAITRRLEQEGKVGAVSRLQFDTWWNGGMRTAPYFHNMIGILTETAHASATPATTYDARSFPRTFSTGLSTSEPSVFYPSPYRGGLWTQRDSCEYMLTASMAVVDLGEQAPRGVAVRHLPDGPRSGGGRPLGDVPHPGRAVGSSNGRGDDQHPAPRRRRDRASARRLRRPTGGRYHAGTYRDSRRAAIPRLSAGPAAPAALSGLAESILGAPGPAVRHHGMDLADADGRARRRRSRPRSRCPLELWAWRPPSPMPRALDRRESCSPSTRASTTASAW